jgi:heme/copper-type cytochrome/quinol oxidase subunit 4
MLTTVWNLLTIVLVLIIIWLTRKQKVTTRLGRYNRTFMIIIAVIQIILIIVGMLIMKDSISLQAASFTCSMVLLISMLLGFKMR